MVLVELVLRLHPLGLTLFFVLDIEVGAWVAINIRLPRHLMATMSDVTMMISTLRTKVISMLKAAEMKSP